MTPDWLYVGADVVEFTPSRGLGGGRIIPAKVDRIGKRDVVLDNGHRYNAINLRKKNGTWEPSTEVLPADDERVAKARALNKAANQFAQASAAWQRFNRSRSSEDARAVVALVSIFISDNEDVSS